VQTLQARGFAGTGPQVFGKSQIEISRNQR